MNKIDAENDKAKWAEFGKTRKTAGRKVISKDKTCSKYRELELEPKKEGFTG